MKKNTKSALLLSVVSIIVCCTMLLGTTMAWFTDSVTSAKNVIVAGNLDVELYHTNAKIKTPTEVDGEEDLFFTDINGDEILWEPGVVSYEVFTVKNVGNLALKYALSMNVYDATATADGKTLEDVIKVAIATDVPETRADVENLEFKALSDFEVKSNGSLVPDKADTEAVEGVDQFIVVLYWEPSENDNDYNMNNENKGTVLDIEFAVELFATQYTYEEDSFDDQYDAAAPWTGEVSYDWYDAEGTAEDPYVLNSAEDLAGFANIVNGTAVSSATTFSTEVNTIQDSFAGKTVKLGANIDLNNIAWTPIGNWDNTFDGTFDGNGYTVSNLYINDPAGQGVGFFGVVQNATIKGVTIKNVDISAYSMVSALVGAAYPSTISDCHVTGDINLVAEWAYVGGIAGYCYYGTQVDNCSVVADGMGSIVSETRNAVGGITAWLLEGDHKVLNCTVKNLDLTGWTNVGGITGFVHYSNTIDGCTVENVNITKTRVDGHPGVGIAAGGWSYNAKNAITITNNSFTNITLNGTAVYKESANYLYGSEYSGGDNSNFVISGNTENGIVNNIAYFGAAEKVATVEQLQKALDNATSDVIIILTADITGDVTVTQKADVKIIIDGNGKTYAGVITVDGKSGTYTTAGLTIKNMTFKADSISADACIRLGDGTNATRYTCNVTVENCTFDVPGAVGVKSYTGGDKNLTISGCTATANAHSLVQAKGIDVVLVENCKVYSKNGLNFNNSDNVTVDNCTVDVKGYAVRFGESSGGAGAAETYTIKNSTLKSANDDGDATIILRGTADNSTLTIENTTIVGNPDITNTATNATVVK